MEIITLKGELSHSIPICDRCGSIYLEDECGCNDATTGRMIQITINDTEFTFYHVQETEQEIKDASDNNKQIEIHCKDNFYKGNDVVFTFNTK